MTKQRTIGAFQVFSLCVTASVFGLGMGFSAGLSPAYFWLTLALFALRSASAALLAFAFGRTGATDFGELLSGLLGMPLSRLLLALSGLLLALRAAVTLSVQTDTVALYLLEDTSGFAVMLTVLISAFAALLPGIRKMSGVSTLFVLTLPLILLVIAAVGLTAADWGELRGLYQIYGGEIAPAFVPAALTASGAECALFFLGRSRSGKHAGRGAVAAPAACGLIFAVMMLVTVGTIGLGGLASERFPLIEASRMINSGGIELTERFDLPLIAVTLTASVVQIAVFTLCAAMALCTAFGSRSTGSFALGLLPVELAGAMLMQYTAFDRVAQDLCAYGLTALTAVFTLLAPLALIRKRRCVSE